MEHIPRSLLTGWGIDSMVSGESNNYLIHLPALTGCDRDVVRESHVRESQDNWSWGEFRSQNLKVILTLLSFTQVPNSRCVGPGSYTYLPVVVVIIMGIVIYNGYSKEGGLQKVLRFKGCT